MWTSQDSIDEAFLCFESWTLFDSPTIIDIEIIILNSQANNNKKQWKSDYISFLDVKTKKQRNFHVDWYSMVCFRLFASGWLRLKMEWIFNIVLSALWNTISCFWWFFPLYEKFCEFQTQIRPHETHEGRQSIKWSCDITRRALHVDMMKVLNF